jgi:hypothetical protein
MDDCRFPWKGYCAGIAVVGLWLAAASCGVKTAVKVPVPAKIAAARTATLQDVLAMLQGNRDRITSLSSSSIKVSLTVAEADSGKAQVYHSAPGYLLLRCPDMLRLNVQVPLTKTTAVELLSRGDQFELWSPRDNKLYIGRNSAKGFELDEKGQSLAFSARPIHIIDAIVPPAVSLHSPDARISMIEEQDSDAKYYVVTLYRETGTPELRVLRSLWIERSQMVLAKEETFNSAGQVEGIVRYSGQETYDGIPLARDISIERPRDGYSLDLRFNGWRVNPALDDSAFALKPPPEATRIILKEKSGGRPETKGSR